MTIALRRASEADLDSLVGIEQRCFTTDRISRRQISYLLRRGKAVTLIAETRGETVGYGMLFTPQAPRPARIYSLAVLPAHRGVGAGSRLVEAMLDEARRLGYRRIRLEVRRDDNATRDLYRRGGFYELAELPGYYADGAPGIRMQMDLTPVDSRSTR